MAFFEPSKTFWQDRYSNLWCFFCPLCKGPRRVSFRPRPGGFKQISQVILTALVFTLVTWSFFGWKGIVSIMPFWTIFEIVYRWRTRMALACPQCGFDAYLFLQDTKLAGKEIDAHWRRKFADKGVAYPEKVAPSPHRLALQEGAKKKPSSQGHSRDGSRPTSPPL